jgi:hypothetical protein
MRRSGSLDSSRRAVMLRERYKLFWPACARQPHHQLKDATTACALEKDVLRTDFPFVP